MHSGNILLAALVLAATTASAQYAGWAHTRKIVMNTSASGANVTGEVKNFPVAVRLTAGNFNFSQAKPDGADLRFSSSAGAPLPYEIESWDAAGQKATVWVKTDVKGSDASQFINLHWGNPAAAGEGDGKAVFAKADGWVGAWHLADKAGGAGAFKDATENAKHGTGMGFTGNEDPVAGPFGPAVDLKRSSKQYVYIPQSEGGIYTLNSSATYSIWVNTRSQGTEYQAMFAKGEGGFRIHYFGVAAWSSHGGRYIAETCLDPGDMCTPPTPYATAADIKPGTWFLLGLVHANNRQIYYVNGKLEEEVGSSGVSSGSEPVTIGNNEKAAGGNSRNRSHDGLLDEARILNAGKDVHWMKLDYESQRPDSKFLAFDGSVGLFHPDLKDAPLAPGAYSIRRYDMGGRLVASVRSTGNLPADLTELARTAGPGLYFDRFVGDNGVVFRRSGASLLP